MGEQWVNNRRTIEKPLANNVLCYRSPIVKGDIYEENKNSMYYRSCIAG